MDFIIALPPSRNRDAIVLVVCRLTKMAHFIPISSHITDFLENSLYNSWNFGQVLLSSSSSKRWPALDDCVTHIGNLEFAYNSSVS